jgi:phosphotransferase system enzyme I (PtsP)
MNSTSLPRVKKALRSIHLSEAQDLLAQVLSLEDVSDVRQRMQLFLAEHGLGQFIHNPVD